MPAGVPRHNNWNTGPQYMLLCDCIKTEASNNQLTSETGMTILPLVVPQPKGLQANPARVCCNQINLKEQALNRVQWASSDPQTKPIPSFHPGTRGWMLASYSLNIKGQPCRRPASGVHYSTIRSLANPQQHQSQHDAPSGIPSEDQRLMMLWKALL